MKFFIWAFARNICFVIFFLVFDIISIQNCSELVGTLKSRTHKRRVFVYYVLYCFSHSHLQINFPRIHMKIPYRRRKLHMSKSRLVVRKTKVNTTRCCCCCSLELRFWKLSEGYVCFDVLRLPVLFLERILSLITLNQTVSAEPGCKNLSFLLWVAMYDWFELEDV